MSDLDAQFLDAYFTRIGHDGMREATMPVLRAIHARHPIAIPFENLDPLLGRPVPLEIAALHGKLLTGRRGGYCYEQNSLLQAVLEALGFRVTVLAARVLWMQPPGAPPGPRTHMLLLVPVDGEDWIVDVGFGGHLSAAPLRLVTDVVQETMAGVLRLRREGIYFTLEAVLSEGWHDIYRFTLEPQAPVDLQVGNWFTATHPNSLFRNSLLLQRLTDAGRISLLNRRLVRRLGGRVEEEVIVTPDDLARAFEEFDIHPPVAAEEVFQLLPG